MEFHDEILDISGQKIGSLANVEIGAHVKVLKCNNCDLVEITKIPKNIELIDCSHNDITHIYQVYMKI